MMDRRQTARARVIYGGVIAYNQRCSTMNCVVRNFSETGVKVEFDHTALLPDEVDLLIARKSRAFDARVVWRSEKQAGLAFGSATENRPIPLDWARRLRAADAERRRLQKRVDQLLSEH
ncbi:MAG TPA: PilZ domain-containing protein [Bradyrhizobium sp.]|nr:PilZ domain-containing protein [Bradyrhizobium sp.]